MPYASRHLYLTFHWTSPGGEEGQFGLRTTDTVMPPSGALDNCWTAAKAMWVHADTDIANQHVLYQMKAALIEPDGRYPIGHVPELRMAGPQAGGGGTILFPLQVAYVTTLEGAIPRGIAGRGRIYLPAFNDTLTAASAQWDSLQAARRRDTVADFIRAVNLALAGTVAVMSTKGAGATQDVVTIRQGTRPDVQRRRAKQQVETYVSEPV